MPRCSTLVNLATDWKIVMQLWAWFYAVCVSVPNHFSLELYEVINFNDVISAADSNIRVRKGCTFHWYIDCRKYYCLICQGRKPLGWPSYFNSSTTNKFSTEAASSTNYWWKRETFRKENNDRFSHRSAFAAEPVSSNSPASMSSSNMARNVAYLTPSDCCTASSLYNYSKCHNNSQHTCLFHLARKC